MYLVYHPSSYTTLFFTYFLFIYPLTYFYLFFFFNDTATTEIYTLSLHDALPDLHRAADAERAARTVARRHPRRSDLDRKSTRLNSSHTVISYAVFCLKKKKKI